MSVIEIRSKKRSAKTNEIPADWNSKKMAEINEIQSKSWKSM